MTQPEPSDEQPDAAEPPPPRGADLARFAELEAENESLRAQVKVLVRTEDQLYAVQTQLDTQLRIFRKLYDLGQRFTLFRKPQQILAELPDFVLYDLGFQRSIAFLDEHGAGTMVACVWDGYYGPGLAEQLEQITLDATSPLLAGLHLAKKLVYLGPEEAPELAELAAALGLEQFLVVPLYGGRDIPIGALFAGNAGPEAALYTQASEQGEASYGLASVAQLASAALNNCLLYATLLGERTQLEQKVADRTAELREANVDLARLDTLRSQFFANVSHELRTPLTLSIAPLEELITQGADLDPERFSYLQTIYNNQLRLLKLINNLLDFARIDAGQMTATFQLEDILTSLRFYVSTLDAAARSRKISLHFVTEMPALGLFVDHDKFEKIAMNLLANAFKFTPLGGAITVRVEDEGEQVEIQVSDTGVGIAPSLLPHIFDRFSRGEEGAQPQYEGSGIGLAMVKEFVALHGGEIRVESEERKGTTFRVRLRKGVEHLDPTAIMAGEASAPESVRAYHLADAVLDDEAPDEPWPTSPRVLPSGVSGVPSSELVVAFQTDGSTVLVVDDVADMRRFIAHVLGKRYRVILARDGADGLAKAREHRPDLIVSDVMMPRLNGYQLCQAIRRDPELDRTPFILLSAKADLAQKIEGLEQGADDYLVKPFNADELLTRVRNLIRIHHQERELLNAFRALEERDFQLTDELTQAKEFQQSILPSPPSVPGLSIETLYEPLELVGGDLYDLEEVGPDRVRLLLCDATGHGMRAALTTMLIKSEYEFIKEPGAGPAALLGALNDRIANAYGRLGVRFTAACVDLDRSSRTLRYAVAAHPSPVLVHHGRARELAGGGAFLGLLPGIDFEEHTEPFGVGDRVYLYTDGVTDAWSPDGEAFGEQRLIEALEEAATQGALGAPIVYDRVCRHIEHGHPQYDDLTLLGLWWGLPPGDEKETR